MYADQLNGRTRDLRNRKVSFRIRDVYVPEPAQILVELHGQDLLCGQVVELSDRGFDKDAFAVVEVRGLRTPVVVPVAKILPE
jgi:hypothetical protein